MGDNENLTANEVVNVDAEVSESEYLLSPGQFRIDNPEFVDRVHLAWVADQGQKYEWVLTSREAWILAQRLLDVSREARSDG
jgi:hypothetical protein